jgi:hypothetical protein
VQTDRGHGVPDSQEARGKRLNPQIKTQNPKHKPYPPCKQAEVMEYQIRRKLGANGPLQREIDKCAALNADAAPSSPGLSYLQVLLVRIR